EREVAVQTLEQYTQQILQREEDQNLAIESELVKRGPALRDAEQKVVKITQDAVEKQKIALQHANRELEVAERDLRAAKNQASAILARGKAEADVIRFNNEAEASAWKEGIGAFNGDGNAYARNVLLQKLGQGYTDIMVNTGDSPLMKIFEEYHNTPELSK